MRVTELLGENISAIVRHDFTELAIKSGIGQLLVGRLDPNQYRFYVALYPYLGSDTDYRFTVSLETGSPNQSIPSVQQPVGEVDQEGYITVNSSTKTHVGRQVLELTVSQRQLIKRVAEKILPE
jgi:hypothetical protein